MVTKMLPFGMAKRFSTTILIVATREAIWALLTDAARYPQWNTTVTRVDGTIAKGNQITVHAKINPGRAFPVKVEVFEPPARMVWVSGMPFGLFKGARTYTLRETDDGRVEFVMREDYTGPLAGMFTRSIPDLQPAFDEFAAALKRRAEQHGGMQ
jgi:hypothetical protein